MAKGFNQVIVMGNLAADPELKNLPSGQSVTSFAVAVNRSWTGSDGEAQEQVDFFDVVAWGKLAELVDQYLSKGRKVMVVGRLQNRSWEAQDGSKRRKTEIVAGEVNFLDRAGEGEGTAAPTSKPAKSDTKKQDKDVVVDNLDEDVDLSEIPF